MTPEAKQKIQLALAVVIAVTAIRAGYIVYERYSERAEEAAQANKKAPPLNADDYVVPKKLYPSDLKSAKQLTRQPVWVREGYHHTYYPFDLARNRTDFWRPKSRVPRVDRSRHPPSFAEATDQGCNQ